MVNLDGDRTAEYPRPNLSSVSQGMEHAFLAQTCGEDHACLASFLWEALMVGHKRQGRNIQTPYDNRMVGR
jgi:hypothetical protein